MGHRLPPEGTGGANNADGDEPLPIKSGNPTIRNTRKITTDYSNKIQFAIHILRHKRTDDLALRQPDDISPIPGCVAFAFTYASYYFYRAAFSDNEKSHEFLSHVLFLIDEQVKHLSQVDRPDAVTDPEYAQAVYAHYLNLERAADYYLYKGLEHVSALFNVLSTTGGADTPPAPVMAGTASGGDAECDAS